jgi:hypothetical protein
MTEKTEPRDGANEECCEPEALDVCVRVPCATKAARLVGAGTSDRSFVGSVRGALRPGSASAGPAAMTCRQQARTQASRRNLLTELKDRWPQLVDM